MMRKEPEHDEKGNGNGDIRRQEALIERHRHRRYEGERQ
jgi:hypothetical protein